MKWFYALIAVLALSLAACTDNLAGNDKDEHGCIGSAGYSWCEKESKCVRPWVLASEKSLDFSTKGKFDDYCAGTGALDNPPIVGNDEDEHGCKASAGYSWCAEKEKCLRTWEELCSSERIREQINESNFCVSDADCALVGSECPFGCNIYVNDDEVETVKSLIESYRSGCIYKCPAVSGVRCIEGKCQPVLPPSGNISKMDEQSCEEASGTWNECSSKCMIDNKANTGIACIAMCEALCECNGQEGFGCPEGYYCKAPKYVEDATGYCEPETAN